MNFLKSVSISLSQLLKEKKEREMLTSRRMIAIIVKVKSVLGG